MLIKYATTTCAQCASFHTLAGVIKLSHFTLSLDWLFEILTGIRIAHPITDTTKNKFRHMRVKRKKTVASSPTYPTKSCSFVRHSGVTHDHNFLPIGGGACFSSACLSFGA